MDRTEQRWIDGEEQAVAELRKLFRQWKSLNLFGEFGVRIRTEGARGPQFVIPTEEQEQKIN